MPQSIIVTKRLSLTEGQWCRVMENMERDDDWDAWNAVVVAPIISETVNPAEEPNEIDAWVIDAANEGGFDAR